ncbi:MAG: amidohydrolase [Candidatus Aminicenantes bacterium]|nr:amidohydrolase [Candidatus Aminicenantes bacterium]
MNKKLSILFLMFGLVFAASFSCQTLPDIPADLVILNAHVLTIDKTNPRAEAVAFKEGKIIAVSSTKALNRFIKTGFTKVIDARGRLVVPGFNDAHAHFGGIDPDYIDLRYITDPAIITERVREKIAESKSGELIRGGRWEHEMFHDKQWPTKELIDSVSPDNPVVLNRADGHSSLVNSYVLRQSNITKDTADPPGGEIQKDKITGEPTGIIKELARRMLKYGDIKVEFSPEELEAEQIREWQAALDMAARLGVTTVHLPPGEFDMLQKFREMGKLTLRAYVGQRLDGLTEDILSRYAELREKYPPEDDWIRFGFLKGHIDGTLGSGTALFFEPFEDEPDKSGLPFQSYEELERIIIAADKMGFQVAIHAIGSLGNNLSLNAIEKAQEINGFRDSRHRIEHAQVLIDEDIPRFARLGVIASMQPTHCITDKRFAEKRIGLERSRGAYAWRRLLDTGARIAFGTDYAVEPLDPLEGLYAAVTRKDRAGELGDGWFPDQKLTMEEAIELYTLGSAYSEFMEERKGIIKKGYLGDVVILNRDLLSIPVDQIMTTKVDYTIVGGKVIYQRTEGP